MRVPIQVLTIAAALLLVSCNRPEEPVRADGSAATPVRVETLQATPVEDFYEASGTVQARQRAVIASRITGTVLAVHVAPGDVVRAGQALAEIEDDELQADLSSAEAAKTAADTARAEAEQGLAAAQADARLAEITFERFSSLLRKETVSQQEFDQAEQRYRASQAAVRMAEARIEAAQARREQAEAAWRAARIRVQYSRITAPFAGIVVEKRVETGSVVAPGMPLLVLESTSPSAGAYRLEVPVSETQAGQVRLGDAVRVSIPAAALELTGRIDEIEPAADAASRTSLVKISLPASNMRALRSGLFGRAAFSQGQETLLTVPSQAVVQKGQLVSAFVVTDGVARQRLVTLGRQFDERREVLSGLSAGEQVVISEPATLLDGARVEVRP